METRANYVAVGIFTLIALLAGFGFVYWTAGLGGGVETATLRVRIPGSASGLGRGSFVLFNGVKVGDVVRVYIDVNNPTVAIADTLVDRSTPITASTGADIGLAGLTGQANIELKGGDPNEANLLVQAEEEGRVAEITANPSAVTNLLQTAQQIFTRADNVLTSLEGFVEEARGPLADTIRNVDTFSQALARNADGIDTFLANVSDLSRTLGGVSERLDSTLAAAEDLLRAVDRDKVSTIVTNAEQFTSDLKGASADLQAVMGRIDGAVGSVKTLADNADRTLTAFADTADKTLTRLADDAGQSIKTLTDDAGKSLKTLTDGATGTLARVDGVLDAVDPDRVKNMVANIDGAAQDARNAASDVAELSRRFSARGDDVERIISDAQQLAERLNQASVRVDGILLKVDRLLGSGDTEGLVAEASATLKSFRQIADTLNGRIGTITDGLARFTGQGLRDAEALIRDGRRSIARIEQAITSIERNPQRLITGGEGTVRQYDGRVRR